VHFTFNAKSKDFRDMLVSSFWHKGKDKEYIGALTLGGEILLLDPASPDAPSSRLQSVRSIPLCIKVDRDGGKFYVGGQEGDITEYDKKTHVSRWVSGEGHGKKVIAGLAVTDKELVSIGWDNKVIFTDKETATYGDSVALTSQPSAICTGHKDRSLVLVTLRKGKLVVIKNKAIVSELEVSYEPQGIDISADDSQVTVSSKQKVFYHYKLEGDKLVETGKNSDSPRSTTNVQYHPTDPNLMVVQNTQNQTLVVRDGKIMNKAGWEYHNAALKTGAWSPDGKRFATGAMDENVIIWTDFEKYASSARSKITGHFQGVTCLDWLDESHLVVCCYDMSIKIWKV
jgi:WD40 repeat protein